MTENTEPPSPGPDASRPYRTAVVMAGVYLALFLVILMLAYTGQLPPWLGRIPNYDKFGHVLLYAIAAYLGHRVCRYRTMGAWSWLPWFPVGFALFTLAEELMQHLSPNRTLDRVDLVASLCGILLGWWLAERTRAKPKSPSS